MVKTSRSSTIAAAIQGIQGNKIKERTESLASLEAVFSRQGTIESFGIEVDGEAANKKWLDLYGALALCMRTEFTLYKPSKTKATKETPVEKRMVQVARILRNLVEKSVEYMNREVVTAVVCHIAGTLTWSRSLIQIVALDYLKTLKHIFLYKPHLDHLDDKCWIKVLQICFNVLLDTSMLDPFSTDDADAMVRAVPYAQDEDDENQSDEDEDEDELPSTSNPRKRGAPKDRKSQQRGSSVPTSRPHQAMVTTEKVECASLLTLLLRSASNPITSNPSLPASILIRFRRFLDMYPSESSLLHDYLTSVALTLDHLALNAVQYTRWFAQRTWHKFVGLWGVKDRRLKEELLIVLRVLLPFLIAQEPVLVGQNIVDQSFDISDGLSKLWHVLDGEAENKWGVNGLSINSIRLELMDPDNPSSSDVGDNPFVATTFRSGWNFDAGQALSWAILELQADCGKELFKLSESTHGTTPRSQANGKRVKLQNPIAALVNSIYTHSTSNVRGYHLQVLLFFIDRHWSILHDSLKHDIVNTLLQFVTFEDFDIQPWVFLNLTAVAFAEKFWMERNPDLFSASQQPEVLNSTIWDQVWAHAVRRANVPGLCRAACHTAHALLVSLFRFTPPSGHIFLTSQQVLLDLESIGKDLEVQGPSFPFDSVCMFLCKCLRIAAQDVRLYRMQLEDKVSKWLGDAWTVTGATRDTVLLNNVSDALLLLETISGFSKQSDLTSRPALPVCLIVESMKTERKLRVIRDYLLFARISTNNQDKPQSGLGSQFPRNSAPLTLTPPTDDVRLEPRPRERKISSFLQRMLDALTIEWDARTSNGGHPSIEAARQALDFTIVTLAFQCTLTLNSTLSNRRVLQSAGKLLASIVAFTKTSRWTPTERMVLFLGIESLVYTSSPGSDISWSGIAPTDYVNDGMMRSPLAQTQIDPSDVLRGRREALLRAIWQANDLQAPLKDLSNSVRSIIEAESNSLTMGQAMDVDDEVGFGPIVTNASDVASAENHFDNGGLLHRLYEVYIPVLSRGPFFQSSPSQPTRDRLLFERVTATLEKDENPQWAHMVLPLLCREIESGTLECNFKQLHGLLRGLKENRLDHDFSRSVTFYCATIRLLHATLPMWGAPDSLSDADTNAYVAGFLGWFCKKIWNGEDGTNMKAWKNRDELVQLLEKYITIDPAESVWRREGLRYQPMNILMQCIKDHDIRVRFRTAVILPRVFVISRSPSTSPGQMHVWMKIRRSLPDQIDNYEQMITQMLTLANAMIVSSAVRRGPYWNLLEICQNNSMYSRHIEAVLSAVVERLGLPSLTSLFEAYSFQLAFSIAQAPSADFLALPPRLLGYKDRASCAEASFRPFVPAYTIVDINASPPPHYISHCRVLQKDPADGQKEWMGDILGYFAAGYWDTFLETEYSEMEDEIKKRLLDSSNFEQDIESNVDTIVSAIFRTLGDQDYSVEGPISMAIQKADPSGMSASVFNLLTRYRNLYPFETHKPNLPTFGAAAISKALDWLLNRVPNAFGKATIYHVIHDLFASIQRTPLVNEKFRLLNSLCMWTALRHEDLADATLLHTLVHGAASLLSQHDLARSAQSILEWTFRTYRKLKIADKRLSRVLVRICAICHEYALMAANPTLSSLGKDLSEWIDGQTYALSQVQVLKPIVMRALSAWPRDPSKELAESCNNIDLGGLSEVLLDEHISSNKFRIVRRLKEYLSNSSDEVEFGTRTFWRLKEYIPPSQRLHEEDAIAFTDLLIHNHGRINSLTAEPTTVHPIRNRQIRLTKKNGSKGAELITEGRDAIIFGLLTLLEDESPILVHTAYNTLRLMMAVLPSAVAHLQSWSPEYRMEVEFLQSYPRPALKRPIRNLSILLSSEFYVEMSSKFSQWITHLAVLTADILASRDASFGQLYSILSTDVATAEQVLPVLILSLLQSEQLLKPPDHNAKSVISQYFKKILESPSSCLPTVRCIVEVVLHLRYFSPRKEQLSSNHWLDLDFLLLARNAVRCGAYTTALLFLELAAEDKTFSDLDSDLAEQIQYEIYAHIDEPDGFYGIQTQNLHQFLMQRLHHEKQWDKAFRFHGAMLEAHSSNPTTSDASGLLQSFHAFGFNQLAIKTFQQSDTWAVSNDSSMSYKLGWRSETWDLPDRDTYSTGAPLYNALRAIYRERDSKTVDSILQHSFYKEIDQLRNLGIESIAEIRGVLQSLMCLNQILSWKNVAAQGKTIDFSKWGDFTSISPEFEFSDLENIMSARIALVRSIRQREERQIGNIVSPFVQDLLELEKRCLLTLSKNARESDQIQIALNSILRARSLGASAPSAEISQEYANVLWSMNEPKLAVTYLNEMLKGDSDHLKANLLSKLGTWTSEACLEKPTEIWSKYFVPAKRLLESSGPDHLPRNASEVFHQCADFADKQYYSLRKSSDMIRRKVYIERKTQEIEERQKQLSQMQHQPKERDRYQDVSRMQTEATKILAADKEQYKKQKSAHDEFLKQALVMYSQSLALSNAFDNDAPIKFSSLWFANFDDEVIKQRTIQKALERIPSLKFIFLAHQLTARITKTPVPSQEKNQEQLQKLVIRLCREHPFHSLYQVYCLQADSVSFDSSSSRRQSGRHSQSQATSQTDRGSAAEYVLERLRDDASVGPRVQNVERVCLAYLQWAKYALNRPDRPKPRAGTSQPIPSTMSILAINHVKVPVLTADTRVDATMQYENCVWLEKYSPKYETAGGVNLPKICSCLGSDGLKYKQLFKGEGKDDMRQDAVMEQVFDLVNKVLSADRETCRRSLQVRSYKVVPLGTQAGVLEFVTNTSPLRDWLLRGHATYRPTDMEHRDCSSKISKAQNSSTEERLRVYNEIRKNFQPVFRHFFTEKHKNPMAWFATRLRYSRSVATTSIVGHILGLGDRHTSNILMDNTTGEVIHIDLGIAFDQGKLLPIPELVPFRLTRDMVDGMGVSGTQGVFQRCAEETLRVLREGSDIIMTVLEVFKYDPLHSWTASEVKIRQAQQDVPVITPINEASRFNLGIGIDMNSGTAEEAADRALNSVARKLDKSLSVESTVNELIAEATDVQNLAVIFHGWGPHL